MQVKFFNPGKEFELHEEEYTKTWKDVRKRGDLILRKDVEEFEANFAKYIGVKYCVGLNSGTDALFIALKALGIKEGDRVLVPSHTFVATAQVVAQLGAEVVLFDIEEDLTDKGSIKAIIVAHIAGEMYEGMQMIKNFSTLAGIPVIEDACQALGATQNGKKAASFGKAGAFSFYPAKILGGPGDGGALVTDDEEVYKFAMEYRNHWKSDYSQWGINSRLDNILAAELNIKLARIEKTLARRKEIAMAYSDGLMNTGVVVPINSEGRVWQDYIIRTEKRDELYDYLMANGCEVMRNEYPMPCGKLPNAAKYEAETLRLPISEVHTDEEIEYVINCIKKFYERPNNSSTK